MIFRFSSGLSSNWRQPSDNFDNVDYLLKMLPYAGGMSYRNQPTEELTAKMIRLAKDSGYWGWYDIESILRSSFLSGSRQHFYPGCLPSCFWHRYCSHPHSGPPWGVPSRVGLIRPPSISPDSRYARISFNTRLSLILLASRYNSLSWLTLSKNFSKFTCCIVRSTAVWDTQQPYSTVRLGYFFPASL